MSRISGRRRRSSHRCLDLVFSHRQGHPFDIECHGTAQMIPTLFQEGGESSASCSLVFFGKAEVLLDHIPDLYDHFVSLNLIFRERGIDLVLAHDAIIDFI